MKNVRNPTTVNNVNTRPNTSLATINQPRPQAPNLAPTTPQAPARLGLSPLGKATAIGLGGAGLYGVGQANGQREAQINNQLPRQY